MDAAGLFSLVLMMLAVVGVFVDIPVVSNFAFWFLVVAYIIYDWGPNWLGTLSTLLLGLAIIGVFIEIPRVSNYAFWVAVAAYFIRPTGRAPPAACWLWRE